MQQYWANIDGTQYGPVAKDELLGIGLTKKSYIWHEGLDEWIKAEACEELADLFVEKEPPVVLTVDLEIGKSRREDDANEDVDADDAVPPQLPQQPQQIPPQLPQQPLYQPQMQYQQPQCATAPTCQQEEPCPPTYLVWGIVSTLMCCQIFGIISIVYGAQVSSKYQQGDIEGAKKYSERAAMWSIISIVVGLITVPFIVAFQIIGALI